MKNLILVFAVLIGVNAMAKAGGDVGSMSVNLNGNCKFAVADSDVSAYLTRAGLTVVPPSEANLGIWTYQGEHDSLAIIGAENRAIYEVEIKRMSPFMNAEQSERSPTILKYSNKRILTYKAAMEEILPQLVNELKTLEIQCGR